MSRPRRSSIVSFILTTVIWRWWGAGVTPAHRLGFALQLGTVRFLGTFPADPTAVPAPVIGYVAAQVGTADLSCLNGYGESRANRSHAEEIRRRYGYRDFDSQPGYLAFLRWLYVGAWVGNERLGVLFDLATARLVEDKVLLPGVRGVSWPRPRSSRLGTLRSTAPT